MVATVVAVAVIPMVATLVAVAVISMVVIDRTTNIFGKTEPKTELIFGRTEYSKITRIFSFLFCWNFTE